MAAHKKKSTIEGHSFRNLLFFLLLYIVGSPFLAPYASLAILAHLSLSIAMFVAIYTVQKQHKQRSFAMALFLPLLVLYWLGIYDIIHFTRFGSYLLIAVYLGLLVYSYILQIARFHRVSINVLYATFCLYLIIGLFWGALYTLLNELSPGAYSGTLLDNVQDSSLHIFNYFSVVTLTTLGYGDITPQTAGAASLCQMEAIVGQFFTAVLVAWLVGMYMSDRQDERSKSQAES
ncbi:MAG: Ion channel protein [Desulfobulbaceae bacterium]|nr:Ion channel protein [Desulfobulbaceae bacterium]